MSSSRTLRRSMARVALLASTPAWAYTFPDAADW
jgi:hypothetical protein